MPSRVFLLLFSLTTLLIFSTVSPSFSSSSDDDDLTFLQDLNEEDSPPTKPLTEDSDDEKEEEEDGGDFSNLTNQHSSVPFHSPELDERDVVIVKERNFTDVIENNEHVMVEFYAPWCGHDCQSLAPEYAAAATELKGDGVVLAKVDGSVEKEVAQHYNVQGFPMILFFVDGEHMAYTGGITKETIVTWVRKKVGPSVYNLTTLDDAERVLTSGNKVVLGYFNSLVGVEHDQLAAASKAEDDVIFYQTVNPDVAKMFHIDPESKRPALVLVKSEEEKISHFDGEFVKSALVSFVSANKLPLVTVFTTESSMEIFESAIKKQLLLFSTKNDSKVLSEFEEAAKSFKGKIIFVTVDVDNEEYGKPVADYFGASGNAPKLVAFIGNEVPIKHYFDGEITSENIKTFGEDFLSDKLKPFYKSDPIPEKNDGDVKIVVGDNFDEIVMDESKDVLLEVDAPWCDQCQTLELMLNKLAKHLRSIDSIVIAKMDGTTNEHPKAMPEGFPTILFFPAGNKTSEPITVDADRTVVGFYKFMRKHATIPFKLEKPASTESVESTPKVETTETKGKPESTTESTESDSKDEL